MLTEQVDRSLSQERLISLLAAVFAGLALGLACFGLYGVMAYGVSRRVPEFGVRMALGATPAILVWTVLRGSIRVISVGLFIGVLAVWLSSGAIAPMLHGVQPNDAGTIASAASVLAAVAILAALLPARKASRIDRVAALRNG
jgi:ABC-type antimicrobial peptide transport system permease subunit